MASSDGGKGNFSDTGGYGGNFNSSGGGLNNRSASAGGNPTNTSGGVGDYGANQAAAGRLGQSPSSMNNAANQQMAAAGYVVSGGVWSKPASTNFNKSESTPNRSVSKTISKTPVPTSVFPPVPGEVLPPEQDVPAAAEYPPDYSYSNPRGYPNPTPHFAPTINPGSTYQKNEFGQSRPYTGGGPTSGPAIGGTSPSSNIGSKGPLGSSSTAPASNPGNVGMNRSTQGTTGSANNPMQGSAGRLFADGGVIPPNEWGIVGDGGADPRGLEMVQAGPGGARVMPMQPRPQFGGGQFGNQMGRPGGPPQARQLAGRIFNPGGAQGWNRGGGGFGGWG